MVQAQAEEIVFAPVGLDVKTVELPGGVTGIGYQCPFCSRVYSNWNTEEDKEQKVPPVCERCGCPMDRVEGKIFADEHSIETPKTPGVADATDALAEAARALQAAADALQAIAAKK